MLAEVYYHRTRHKGDLDSSIVLALKPYAKFAYMQAIVQAACASFLQRLSDWQTHTSNGCFC